MHYNHTQIGYLIIFALAAVSLMFGVILMQEGMQQSIPQQLIILFMIPILFVLISFTSLNVTVDENDLRIKFGWGIYRKRFPLSEIAYASVVRNHWYYGWGIRVWFWPYMRIYNVSGFDAVEIKLRSGRKHRIGTDEPKKLERAIAQQI